MFGLFERIQHASLSGFALLLVMLACLLVGAVSTRLAIELDARELWRLIMSKKPKETPLAPSKEDEHE